MDEMLIINNNKQKYTQDSRIAEHNVPMANKRLPLHIITS